MNEIQSQSENRPKENRTSSLSELAEVLQDTGLGPISRMCNEVIMQTERGNPDCSAIYSEEAAKFAEMGWKIAPPKLLSEYVKKACKGLPPLPVILSENATEIFNKIGMLTEAPKRSPLPSGNEIYLYPRDDVKNYLEYTMRDPSLSLSVWHMSIIFTQYFEALAQKISDPIMAARITRCGHQFYENNVLSLLPLSLHKSLTDEHGSDANFALVDHGIIKKTLNRMHDNKQFVIRVPGQKDTPTEGIVNEFQCPMERYVCELLLKHKTLQSVISSMLKIKREINAGSLEDPKSAKYYAQYLDNDFTMRTFATERLHSIGSQGWGWSNRLTLPSACELL
jgi:hypothetical protein